MKYSEAYEPNPSVTQPTTHCHDNPTTITYTTSAKHQRIHPAARGPKRTARIAGYATAPAYGQRPAGASGCFQRWATCPTSDELKPARTARQSTQERWDSCRWRESTQKSFHPCPLLAGFFAPAIKDYPVTYIFALLALVS